MNLAVINSVPIVAQEQLAWNARFSRIKMGAEFVNAEMAIMLVIGSV